MKVLILFLLFSCSNNNTLVSWDLPRDIDNVTHYKVYYRDDVYLSVTNFISLYFDKGQHCVSVTAFNIIGESEKSEINCINIEE